MVEFLKQLVFFAFRIFNKVTNVTRKRCNGMRLKQDNRQAVATAAASAAHESERRKKMEEHYRIFDAKPWGNRKCSDIRSPNEISSLRETKRMPGKRKSPTERKSLLGLSERKSKTMLCSVFLHKIVKIVKDARQAVRAFDANDNGLLNVCARLYVHALECERLSEWVIVCKSMFTEWTALSRIAHSNDYEQDTKHNMIRRRKN